jgi:methylmalonyl-CoA mutase cobalamin-binding domain/chain
VSGPEPTVRALVTVLGLDQHEAGSLAVARILRDHGIEVIYGGRFQLPHTIADVAVQEDVDVIGVSLLSGAHMTLFPQIIELMKEQGVFERHILIGGGVMPDEDVEELLGMGVQAILGQDTPPDAVADTVKGLVARRGVRV